LQWWDHFDEEHIENDFAMAKWLGCNTLRLSFHFKVLDRNPANPRIGSAEDFKKCDFLLDCAQRNGLKLYLEPKIDGSSPQVTPDIYLWKAAVEKVCTRYQDHPAVFYWQLDWENITLVGYDGDRETWNHWIKEKYGSFAAASKVWKTALAPDVLWEAMRNLNHHTHWSLLSYLKPRFASALRRSIRQALRLCTFARDHSHRHVIYVVGRASARSGGRVLRA